jgi:hypothetical protein
MKITAVAAGLAFPHAAQVMAALRNLAITIPRLAGYASIATRNSPPRPQAGPAPTDDHELLMLTLPRPWVTASAITWVL